MSSPPAFALSPPSDNERDIHSVIVAMIHAGRVRARSLEATHIAFSEERNKTYTLMYTTADGRKRKIWIDVKTE